MFTLHGWFAREKERNAKLVVGMQGKMTTIRDPENQSRRGQQTTVFVRASLLFFFPPRAGVEPKKVSSIV